MKNRIIKEMLDSGNISEREAKKIFRKYSKQIHPDITKKDTNEEFIKLKEEYEEAILFVKNPAKLTTKEREGQKLDQKTLRKQFYQLLSIYITSGIYSQKIRLKTSLKERNEKIINTIIKKGNEYDEEFSTLFKNFNTIYIQPFEEWWEERQLKNATKLLINGIRSLLEYQKNGNILTLRMAESYLKDARYEYSLKANSEYQKNTIKLIDWFLKELSKEPLGEDLY